MVGFPFCVWGVVASPRCLGFKIILENSVFGGWAAELSLLFFVGPQMGGTNAARVNRSICIMRER